MDDVPNMLTNFGRVRVNENMKEKIKFMIVYAYMLLGKILWALLEQWNKSLKIVVTVFKN